MQLHKNHLIPWVISGCIGVIIRDIYSLMIYLFGVSKITIWMIAADLFIDKPDFHTLLGTVIGILVDLCIGGSLGIMIGIMIDWQDRENYLFLGLGVALFAWMFFYGIVLHNLPQTIRNVPHNPKDTLLALLGHEIWGASVAWIYIKLLDYLNNNKSLT